MVDQDQGWALWALGGHARAYGRKVGHAGGFAQLVDRETYESGAGLALPQLYEPSLLLLFASADAETPWETISMDGEALLPSLLRSADNLIADAGCECGSGLPSEFSPMTKGFDCAVCRASIVVHETCGTAFYTWDGDVCDVCGEG